MNESYSVSCDYGGIGNFQESNTACLLCPHEIECSHEQELAQLDRARARRVGDWRYPNRSSPNSERRTVGGVVSRTMGGSIGGLQPSGRRRSRRPMPIPGENPLSRAGKNILMTMLSSGFHEAGDFCEEHDLAHIVNNATVPVPLPAPDKKE